MMWYLVRWAETTLWMDVWIDGWLDGWMSGWMDGWMGGSIYTLIHPSTVDEWTGERMQTDEYSSIQTGVGWGEASPGIQS